MLKAALMIAGALLAMEQLGSTNTGINAPQGVRGGDSGIDSDRTPSFTGGIVLRPEPGSYDQAPAWIRQPEPARIGLVFPAQAVRTGQDGSVEMKCRLTVDGALTGCTITRESPAGVGFGAAARALTPDLNVRPAQQGGRPVASDVSFSIQFTGPGSTTVASRTGVDTLGAQRFLPSVAWIAAPTYEQVVGAYPAAARAGSRGGRATIDCIFAADGTLRNCGISNEEPVGLGFGEAAKALSPYFRAPPTLANGASIEGAAVAIPVTFSERMLASGGRATGKPALSSMPANTDFGRAFPAQARQAAVLSGTATIECAIAPGGTLSGCTVASETPPGMGFGAAALSLAPKFQVNPWTAEGLPVDGGRIRVPMRYELKAGA